MNKMKTLSSHALLGKWDFVFASMLPGEAVGALQLESRSSQGHFRFIVLHIIIYLSWVRLWGFHVDDKRTFGSQSWVSRLRGKVPCALLVQISWQNMDGWKQLFVLFLPMCACIDRGTVLKASLHYARFMTWFRMWYTESLFPFYCSECCKNHWQRTRYHSYMHQFKFKCHYISEMSDQHRDALGGWV